MSFCSSTFLLCLVPRHCLINSAVDKAVDGFAVRCGKVLNDGFLALGHTNIYFWFTLSAEVMRFAEIVHPLENDFVASCFQYFHNVAQCFCGDLRISMAQVAATRPCNPNLRCICRGSAFRDVDVYRLQRIILICPKVHPVPTNLKNLRHGQNRLPERTA